MLSKGYAVATANFNTFQTSCNDVLSAETAMMVKEHVAETIGAPRFTIGAGASGGAIQQLMIAQNYPGILDALSPVIPFPDAISVAPGVSDCGLLAHYYASPSGQGLTDAQQAAINGHRTTGTCRLWISSFLSTIDPTVGCDSQIPANRIFSAANPKGIRCTLQDLNRNEFGIDPTTGFARRPLDNVGVQYGLRVAQRGHDHGRPVPRPQRVDRRLRHQRAARRRSGRRPGRPTSAARTRPDGSWPGAAGCATSRSSP